MDEIHVIDTSRIWLLGVVYQGERLLRNHEDLLALLSRLAAGSIDADGRAKFKYLNELRIVEEHFFVIAVGKAMQWLALARPIDPELKTSIDRFQQEVPDSKDIRNMREHDDAYFEGRGHAQSRFVHVLGTPENPNSTATDGTSTVIRTGEYLLGGRLCVQKAISGAQRLLPAVETTVSHFANRSGFFDSGLEHE